MVSYSGLRTGVTCSPFLNKNSAHLAVNESNNEVKEMRKKTHWCASLPKKPWYQVTMKKIVPLDVNHPIQLLA